MTISIAQSFVPAAAHLLSATAEASRQEIDAQIGPRRRGAIYQNTDGAFEVLSVVTDPAEARALLRRDSAQWALIVRDVLRAGGEPFAVGTVWSTTDHLVREAPDRVCSSWGTAA
ncbi:hypothetical protein [Streptomyces chrestomyceticus]|uniref:Uncharacterized protein n=1 Tax=Streptomyces chrestomyceticus TaxID=68185 RepID=A0ABU7X1C2_9ACTN